MASKRFLFTKPRLKAKLWTHNNSKKKKSCTVAVPDHQYGFIWTDTAEAIFTPNTGGELGQDIACSCIFCMYHTKGNGLQQILGGNFAFCEAWIDNTGEWWHSVPPEITELSSHQKTYRSLYCSSFTRCMFSLPGWESKHAADWRIYIVTHSLLHNDEEFRVSVYIEKDWWWCQMVQCFKNVFHGLNEDYW